MNEWTFQQELHQLKLRVADMATRHARNLPAPHPFASHPHDSFTNQMHDVKAHLATLDQRLSQLHSADSTVLHPTACVPQEVTSRERQDPFGAPMSDHRQPHLEPLASYGTPVQGLDPRFESLQQTVLRLEDRLDRLDPNRFTPPASTTSAGEGSQDSPRQSGCGKTATSNAAYHETLHNGIPTEQVVYPDRHSNEVVTARDPSAWEWFDLKSHVLDHGERSTASVMQVMIESVRETIQFSRRCNDTFRAVNKQSAKKKAALAHAIVNLTKAMDNAELKAIAESSAKGPEILAWTNDAQTMEANNSTSWEWPTRETSATYLKDGLTYEPVFEVPAPLGRSQRGESQEGVAFRDQEIARLDEQLRNAQTDLSHSEQFLAEQVEAIEHLNGHIRHEKEQSYGLGVQLSCVQADVLSKDHWIFRLNDIIREKDLQLAALHAKLPAADLQSLLSSTEAQVEDLQAKLHEHEKNKITIGKTLCDQVAETRKLQEVCESKIAIVHKQHLIISRGARLMSERDDEIEELGRRLRAAEEDRDHEERQKAHLAQLHEEGEERWSRLRADIKQACAVPQRSPRHFNGDLKYPDKQLAFVKARLHDCAQAADVAGPPDFDLVERVALDGTMEVFAVSKGDRQHSFKLWDEPGPMQKYESAAPEWSPRPTEGYGRLHGEAERASVWEHGEHSQMRHEFGKPGLTGHFAQSKSARGRQRNEPRLIPLDAHDRPVPSVSHSRQTTDEETSSLLSQDTDSYTVPAIPRAPSPYMPERRSFEPKRCSPELARRHQLSFDCTTVPPLPAPVGAQRMQSMADMRSAAHGEPHKRMMKHQSMQELHVPRQRLRQAYVETDAESGGELGGDV